MEFSSGSENENVHVSDDLYAEELQLQEALEASLSNLQISFSRKAESSRSFCDICKDEKENHEMFKTMTCFHSFCTDCTGKHVKTQIELKSYPVTCPGFNCQSFLELDSCRSIISADLIDRLEAGLTESTIPISQKFYCPYKNCSAILQNDNGEEEIIRESKCPECQRLFCAQCKVPWHPGFKCIEFQKFNENERDEADLDMRKLAKKKKWPKCPNCNYIVEKTEGCIHMTCNCGFEFCYTCGLKWSESSHWSTCQRG